ncbi:MAG: hypothetical protein L0229_18090 [Blastocatellia bacterium]|nr:hypothetical protein [Blastocatellia bacterium]
MESNSEAMKRVSTIIDTGRKGEPLPYYLRTCGEKTVRMNPCAQPAVGPIKNSSSAPPSARRKSRTSYLFIALFSILAIAVPAQRSPQSDTLRPVNRAANIKTTCGYDPRGAEKALLDHKANLLRAGRTKEFDALATEAAGGGRKSSFVGPRISSIGDIAVIEDDGTIVVPPSKFDLKNRSVLLAPDGSGYRVTNGAVEFDSEFGTRLTGFTDDFDSAFASDDGYLNIALEGARFPFSGSDYDEIFVGTNGYVTFTGGDSVFNPSAAVLASDLPRIAPLWADLDITNKGRIYYKRLEGRHLITWNKVPHAVFGGSNTFQLALYDDGRIAFVYKKVKARPSIMGISPGGAGDARALDFSSPPDEKIEGSIYESFSKQKRLDVPALTRAFYSEHGDLFDTLYLWTDFSFDNGPGIAHSFNVRNDIEGIGLGKFDRGADYGSPLQLSTIITMGNAKNWPADPDAIMAGINSALSIVCHELGHRWLVYIRFNEGRATRDDLLGRDLSHWSFLAETRTDSNGTFSSLMEGNAWRDNGNGTFTTIESAVNYFSQLDQYLMGLRAADEVADTPYLTVPEDLKELLRSRSPVPGFTLSATRKFASVDQIISREGARVPDSGVAPKRFRIGFVLLTEQGTTASDSAVNKLDRYRDSLVKYFSIATGRRASLDSSL